MSKHNQLIGAFVLRNEGDGCLLSKYFHNNSKKGPFTEACKLIKSDDLNDGFIGHYQTVWLEDENKHVCAELIIERHPDNPALYKMTWYDPGPPADTIFEGSAMLYNNTLIGNYWN